MRGVQVKYKESNNNKKKRNDKLCYSVSKTLAEKELCSQEIDSAVILLQEFVILGGWGSNTVAYKILYLRETHTKTHSRLYIRTCIAASTM